MSKTLICNHNWWVAFSLPACSGYNFIFFWLELISIIILFNWHVYESIQFIMWYHVIDRYSRRWRWHWNCNEFNLLLLWMQRVHSIKINITNSYFNEPELSTQPDKTMNTCSKWNEAIFTHEWKWFMSLIIS